MYLQIQEIIPEKIWEYKNNFPKSYLHNLQNKPFFCESVFARGIISEYIWNGYLSQEDENWAPIFHDSNFWSLSHKTGCVFVWVSDSEIGVDIEYLLEKSHELISLFPQKMYDMCGGKNWKNFYTLWTSFEAIQKMRRWKDISWEEFSLLSFELIKADISEIPFQTRTLYERKGKNYQVFTGFLENKVYSVCTSQNIDYEIMT